MGASGGLPTKFTCKVYSLLSSSSSSSSAAPLSTPESTLSPVPPNSIPLVLQGKGGGAQQAVPSSHPGLSPPTIYTLYPCKAGGGVGSSSSSNPFPTLPPLAIPVPPISTIASSFTASTIPIPQQPPFTFFTLEAPPTAYPPTHLLTTSPAPDVCAHPPGIKSGHGLLPLGPPLPSHALAHPRFLLSLRLPFLVAPEDGEGGGGVLLFANLPPPVAMNYLLSLLTRAAGGEVLRELEDALGCTTLGAAPTVLVAEGSTAEVEAGAAGVCATSPRMAALASLLSTPSLNPPSLPLVLRCLAHTLLFSSLKPTTTSPSTAPVCAVCDAARPHSQRIPLTRAEWDRVCTAFTALILAYPRVQMSVSVKAPPPTPPLAGGAMAAGSSSAKAGGEGGGGGGDWRSEKDWKAAVALEESAWRAWEPQWEVTFANVL